MILASFSCLVFDQKNAVVLLQISVKNWNFVVVKVLRSLWEVSDLLTLQSQERNFKLHNQCRSL